MILAFFNGLLNYMSAFIFNKNVAAIAFPEKMNFLYKCRYNAGWYMLEYKFDASRGRLLKISCIDSCGIVTFFWMPSGSGNIKKRIIFFENKIFYMELFFEKEKKYSQNKLLECFQLKPVFPEFSTDRMMGHLGKRHCEIKQIVNGGDKKSLFFLYNLSFYPTELQYPNWIARREEGWAYSSIAKSIEGEKFVTLKTKNCKIQCGVEVEIADFFKKNPSVKILYVDEDTVNENGQHLNPYFKPDWNPDLFFSYDYTSLSCCFCRCDWYEEHRSIFDEYGTRLALTYLMINMCASEITRMPQILVHKENGNESINDDFIDKRIIVLKYILGDSVVIKPGLLPESLRLCYTMPEKLPFVSLLIPTRDSLQILKSCVESVLESTTYPTFEVIIINNQSKKKETLDWFESVGRDERVKVLSYACPFNYSSINNFAVKHAKGDIIGLINNDVEVISPDWLTEMVSHACRPEIGCVGAKLYYSDGRIQHAGVILSEHNIAMHGHRYFDGDADGYQGRLKLVQNYSAVTGACLVVRKEIYEQVGGLNEEHLAVAYNDVDFCLKVREAGYRNLWTPYAKLYHHESVSRGSDDTPAKRKRLKKEAAYMRKTWAKELANDPCYNPNLTPLKEDFSLRVI